MEWVPQLTLSRTLIEDFIFTMVLAWGGRLIKVLLIILLTRLALRFGNVLITRLFSPSPGKASFLPENKAKTLIALLLSIWRYTILALAMLQIISVLQVMDIGPILAGAGILGLAVGFGAQHLVRDVITGFFIILEDQFSVGDYITTGSFTGIVEELGLRITKIRDFSGELHIIPNGKIEAVTNRSQGSMRAMVDVGVAYEEDIDHVLAVLEELCRQYSEIDADVVEGPTVLGVNGLGDSAVTIRIIARTVPMTQWKVERDLRRAIKNKFDEQGFGVPYPRRIIYQRGNDQKGVAGD